MSIKKTSDGQWKIDIQPGGRGGERIRKIVKTRAEALQFETWAKSKVQNGEWKPKKETTMAEVIEHWSELNKHLDDYVKRLAVLKRIAAEHEHMNPREWNIYLKNHSNLSQATKNRHLAYCRAALNRAFKDKLIKEHPLINTRPTKEPDSKMRILTRDEIKYLLENAKDDLLLVIKMCLSTGSRWEESNEITPAQIQKGELRFENTKSGKNRAVPISEELMAEILEKAKGKNQNERIFPKLYVKFRLLILRLQIILPKGQLTHILRHSFAEHFLTNGGNLRDLQEILGHSSIIVTMRYSHFQKEHLKNVVNMNPLSKTNI